MLTAYLTRSPKCCNSVFLGNIRHRTRVTQVATGDKGTLVLLQSSKTQPHASSQSSSLKIIPSEMAFYFMDPLGLNFFFIVVTQNLHLVFERTVQWC